MFAKVLRLRAMGALVGGPRPPESDWKGGIIFETSDFTFGAVHRCPRRQVLRHANSAPDMGQIFELYQPLLVQVLDPCLRFRGIEAVPTGNGQIGAVVQEWLVLLR
jgi:hypothetical protein